MARKKSQNLTEAEFRLMKVLWKKQTATVGEVVDALADKPALAYSTVLTTLRILENKGYVRHTKSGRAFVYEPAVAQQEESRKVLRHFVSRFFGGSPGQLVLKLLEDKTIHPRELEIIKKKINEAE